MNLRLDDFRMKDKRDIDYTDLERYQWLHKIRDIIEMDHLEKIRPGLYLYHPLPGRKMYHVLRVEPTPGGKDRFGRTAVITCSCQGMMTNDICSHAIALRILLEYPREQVIYAYRAPGPEERKEIEEYKLGGG